MASSSVNLKRKNIDLPTDALQKLSLMAVIQGKSLKAYIESILISKANDIKINITENPSPNGDAWFDNPSNIELINNGISQQKAGKTKAYSLDEIKEELGL